LYGVIEAFHQGRMPDNKQIDETLKYIIDHSPSKLSHDGQQLVQDTRDIIEAARVIVAEKNADELFQNFVWHTRDVDLENMKKDLNEVLPVDQKKANVDGRLGMCFISFSPSPCDISCFSHSQPFSTSAPLSH
jgi:hypothetical protein